MFVLKSYQKRAVTVLEDFLLGCQTLPSIKEAYQVSLQEQSMPDLEYKQHGFENVPYVCLRIPTGGGKTILGSYAVDIAARKYLNTDAPITLWLVPTNTIRLQTVEALKTPGHPYRAKLDNAFKHQVLVLDIEEVTQIRPQDIGSKAIVVVSTIASLRVSNTAGRKVYAYHENFEPHFAKIPANHPSMPMLERVVEEDIQENGLNSRELGKIKYSFANLLALYRPLVIVDEAHNARTPLTFDTLIRVHPAAIVELTATPNTTKKNGSNVLFHVSASELKAEEMIKLPIVLTEHQNWQDAIQDSVITRNKLALDAQKDTDYIRPIALFQAEARNGKVTVEVLKDHLVNNLNIDENKIAIATGNQRELDGINLFDQQCEIEYIITIEALKEGWDCSFAYVFCSVKQVSSSKDAEQLLGRVLRMPYAKRRVVEDLNRAYAHLATSSFGKAAQELTDKLVTMGFEEMEIAAFLKQQAPSEHLGQADWIGKTDISSPEDLINPPAIFELSALPDVSGLSDNEKAQISMSEKDGVAVVRIEGAISENIQNVLAQQVKSEKDKESLQQNIRVHNKRIEVAKAPSERGEVFGSLPLVCLENQQEIELLDSATILYKNSWSLLDYPAELKNFSLSETTHSFSIDMDGGSLKYKIADKADVIPFNQGFTDVTENDLVRWLDRELRQVDVVQRDLIKFLSILVKKLLQTPALSLTTLVRNKFPLSRAINDLINRYRKKAQKVGYQESLFGNEPAACLSDEFVYDFTPNDYPARLPYYFGRFQFNKHYFPLIEDLKSSGEEYECAKAIEGISEIKYWIRNLVRREKASFKLPLAHGNFYPDFICTLEDGRMLVVEYKGDSYVSNDDSAEKRAIGHKWAELSEGKCLFIMAVEQDEQGRDVRQQIIDLIK